MRERDKIIRIILKDQDTEIAKGKQEKDRQKDKKAK
jgi:hypothetical protein